MSTNLEEINKENLTRNSENSVESNKPYTLVEFTEKLRQRLKHLGISVRMTTQEEYERTKNQKTVIFLKK